MNKANKYYLDNLKKIKFEGSWDEKPRPKWPDGKSAYTKFITGVFETYDLSKGEYPITTLRRTAFKTAIKEILWIYQKQSNNLSDARNMGINWWDEWDIGNETIGNRYGYTVKKYNLIDKLLKSLKENPFGRRHIINLYQESDLESSSGLFPCAYETLWSVRRVNGQLYLDCTLNQRSNDYIVAGYINKIQYVALQLMLCSHLGYKPGKFNHFVQNLHVYDRHLPAIDEILIKEKSLNTREDINLIIDLSCNKNFFDIELDDFILPKIKIEKLKTNLGIAI